MFPLPIVRESDRSWRRADVCVLSKNKPFYLLDESIEVYLRLARRRSEEDGLPIARMRFGHGEESVRVDGFVKVDADRNDGVEAESHIQFRLGFDDKHGDTGKDSLEPFTGFERPSRRDRVEVVV